MDPATLAIAHWLVSNVGLPVLNAGMDRLLVQMGIKDPPLSSRDQILIKKYIQQLEKEIRQIKATLDEDRLARLQAALVQVSESQKTVARREYLTNALNNFHVVANYSERGLTGKYTNAQLRCIAFVGMAAAHTALNDSQSLVAEKVAEAVYADVETAKEWLGEKLVNQILPLLPSPQRKPSAQVLSQESTLHLTRLPAFVASMVAFQIHLDDKVIGEIQNRKSCSLEIKPGHHKLSVGYGRISSSPLFFDISSNEHVTFLCQMVSKTWSGSLQLWKQ